MTHDTPQFALTIRDPWAQAIVHGDKRIENRTWKPPEKVMGARIAIHCGKTFGDNGDVTACYHAGYAPAEPYNHPDCIIGTALVSGYVDGSADHWLSETVSYGLGMRVQKGYDVTKNSWWTGPIGWLLDDVRELVEPVPARGMPGVWTIDNEIREKMEEA